jgi:hypothetical protein
MFEKVYALLSRLYPSRFLKMYGDTALQLFRDRSRDERGCLSRLQVWLDLLFDLAISLPSEHKACPSSAYLCFSTVSLRRYSFIGHMRSSVNNGMHRW